MNDAVSKRNSSRKLLIRAAFGAAVIMVSQGGCTHINFENTKTVAPGHEQCIQNYINRARALQEDFEGIKSTIDDVHSAKRYAIKVEERYNSVFAVQIPLFKRPTQAHAQEAAAINYGLWVSARYTKGVLSPIGGREYSIHCRDYSPSIK